MLHTHKRTNSHQLTINTKTVLYHQALGTAVRAPNPKKHMAATYAVENVSVYAVWAALEIAIACTHGQTRVDVHMAEVVFAVTVNIASAIIFWVYGTCVYNKYRVLANSFVIHCS